MKLLKPLLCKKCGRTPRFTFCKPLGNIIVIQDDEQDCPNDFSGGGTIAFDWDMPIDLQNIEFLDVNSKEFTLPWIGNNGYYKLDVGEKSVIWAWFP